jgi:uncharacterized protein YjbI with pentapeptide repeats
MAKKSHANIATEVGRIERTCRSGQLHAIFTPQEKSLLCAQRFRDCEFNRVDFSSANLRETQFVNVSLKQCDFSRSDLRGASFIGCDLRGANFAGAAFDRTRFDNSVLIGAHGLSSWMSEYAGRNGGWLWLS